MLTSIASMAATLALAAAPVPGAPPEPGAAQPPSAAEAPALSFGDPALPEEMDEARGGFVFAIVWGGTVYAVRSCASNAICRVAAAALAKQLGKRGADWIIENSRPALERKLCRSGYRRYC